MNKTKAIDTHLICLSSEKDSGRAGPERGMLLKHVIRVSDMLPESYNMLSIKQCSCVGLTYCSYRQCGPARVSSKQDSGRAGPEKIFLYKHKSRVYLVYSKQSCYLLSSKLVVWRTHLAIGSVGQLGWAANRTLAEQDLRRVCCINTNVGFIW